VKEAADFFGLEDFLGPSLVELVDITGLLLRGNVSFPQHTDRGQEFGLAWNSFFSAVQKKSPPLLEKV